MELKNYFENAKGTGILATADKGGQVDLAVYSRPHMMEDGTVALIMADRLSHHNLQSNDHAAYLFLEHGPGYKGTRLFLTKIHEEKDSDRLYELRRRTYPAKGQDGKSRFLVFFKVDRVLPLVGAGEEEEELQ